MWAHGLSWLDVWKISRLRRDPLTTPERRPRHGELRYGGGWSSAVIYANGGPVSVTNNNIIAFSGSVGVQVWSGIQLTSFGFNDVYNPGHANYSGVADRTGSNGNLSLDPLFRDRANNDFHILSSSPLVDAGYGRGAPTSDHDRAAAVDPVRRDGVFGGRKSKDRGHHHHPQR